jgi:hypothetical protein
MKKHIIGLMLFSFIVSAAVVIYGFLNILFPVPNPVTVYLPQYVPSGKTHCNLRGEVKESKISSVKVKQAVINLQTKEFSWEIDASKIDAPVNLHFFSKENGGTYYITSSPFVALSHTGRANITEAFDFMHKPVFSENLYVIGDYYYESKIYGKANPPKFDINKATSVTIDYGK